MDHEKLNRDLASVDPIPDEGIAQAVQLMKKGLLFRYGEFGAQEAEAALLESEFAAYVGTRYAVALNSCGCALFVALKCMGIGPGDKVLVNAFTLAPVPGAIAHAGATPVLIESTEDLLIDLDDLRAKASSGARVLLLSHMRGHIADLDALMALCTELDIQVIEDCAHTMGAKWNDRFTGTYGRIGCFSAQTFKHINAGEGGLLVTDDEEIAAKAILYSGSYMLYRQHIARPADEVFERFKLEIPNFSMRMSNLVAAIARPQIRTLASRAAVWNDRYDLISEELHKIPQIAIPRRLPKEAYVGSSIQFFVKGLSPTELSAFVTYCAQRGVQLKWFGDQEPIGFTSKFSDWKYIPGPQVLLKTAEIMRQLCDMRIPLAISHEECQLVAKIIRESLQRVSQDAEAAHD